MSYPATETCQIRLVKDSDADSGLVVHEGTLDPICGTRARPWHGHESRVVALGAGTVTCGSCARCTT